MHSHVLIIAPLKQTNQPALNVQFIATTKVKEKKPLKLCALQGQECSLGIPSWHYATYGLAD